VRVSEITNAIDVTAGKHLSCAIVGATPTSTTGQVKCWGFNAQGQLGDGGAASSSAVPINVEIHAASAPYPLLDDAKRVFTGYLTACALRASDRLFCWGNEQLGGTGPSYLTRAKETILPAGRVVAAGLSPNHGCAQVEGVDLRCWGYAYGGQIGQPASSAIYATPVTVAGLGGALDVTLSADGQFSCVTLDDPGVPTVRAACFGNQADGHLGNGVTTGAQPNPGFVLTSVSPMTRLGTIDQLVAGGGFTCALLEDGAVRCWGLNSSGEHGTGSMTPASIAVCDLTHTVTNLP
jgi:alpha-tubulin suppressor-like RCC1 family protein